MGDGIWSSLFYYCCSKHHDRNHLRGGKGFFTLLFIGHNLSLRESRLELMHNLKQNIWRYTAYWLALCFDQLSFTYSPGQPAQMWCHSLRVRSLYSKHQSRQSLTGIDTGQPEGERFSVEISSSQVTLSCIKSTTKLARTPSYDWRTGMNNEGNRNEAKCQNSPFSASLFTQMLSRQPQGSL